MSQQLVLQRMQQQIGQEIHCSEWLEVTQQRIDAFAAATGDHQWIHVDPVRAASGPFKTTVAHGFLTLSLLPELLANAFVIDDVRMGVNYGLNRVRFPTRVPAGSRLRAHFRLLKYEPLDRGAQLTVEATIELEGSSKPACVAEAVSRRFV